MKKILLTAGAVIFGAFITTFVLALRKPDTFEVTRSIVINAPAEKIFPLIDDFREWQQWSPYETKDPEMKRTFSAETKGRGATYAWDSNGSVGTGSMTITDDRAPSFVAIKLDMEKPLHASNDVRFTLTPEDTATRVTWSMRGPAPLISKVMQVVFDFDKMVGGDFTNGLAKLKATAEK